VHLALADAAAPARPGPPIRWLVLGSQARGEQTLHTDQDTAMLLPEGLDAAGREHAGELGTRVTNELVALGYPRCDGGVMASEAGWRIDASTWRARVGGWITEPSAANIMHAQIAFDLREILLQSETTRGVRSDPPSAAALHAEAVAAVASAPLVLARLARESLRHRAPIGFFGRFVVARAGDHEGTLDLKSGALLPIVNAARLHALAVGSTSVTTSDRLDDIVREGSMSGDLASVLREGHELAQRLRLEQQVAALEAGAPPGNRVDPRDLSPLVRSDLREVFKAIRTAQEAIESRWRTGLLG
jgi:CBS domain-containing protein